MQLIFFCASAYFLVHEEHLSYQPQHSAQDAHTLEVGGWGLGSCAARARGGKEKETHMALTESLCLVPVKPTLFRPPPSASAQRKTAVLMEQVGRSREMLQCVEALLEGREAVGPQTLDLLGRAYKLMLAKERDALRVMRAVDDNQSSEDMYRGEVMRQCEEEIKEVCRAAVHKLSALVARLPQPVQSDPPAHVMLHTLIGDYYRYLCEVEAEEAPRLSADHAYATAATIAAEHLPPEHPLRLGLALNRSILCYEIMKAPDQGVAIAKQAFDCSTGSSGADAARVLERLRENVSMWTENEEAADDEHLPKKDL